MPVKIEASKLKGIYSPLNYGKFILQRSDPQGIKYCLGRYSSIFEGCDKGNKEEVYVKYGENQGESSGFREFERKIDSELLSAELRNFWPNWKTTAVRLLTNKRDLADRLLDEHLRDMLKHEYRKELDFIVICVAKIIELKSVKVPLISIYKIKTNFSLQNLILLRNMIQR